MKKVGAEMKLSTFYIWRLLLHFLRYIQMLHQRVLNCAKPVELAVSRVWLSLVL